MRTEARFPEINAGAGHYESFFVKAADPAGGRALWLRHTIHQRPGEPATCAVWLTWFDAASGPPKAAKQQYGAARLSTPDDAYVRIGASEIGPGWVRGEVAANEVAASWELRFTDRHDSLRHLPSEWMYGARLPRTKLLSPHPGALFEGAFEIDGERIELEGWPGSVGHNWGSEHAERWVWIQGAGLEGGEPADYLDIAAGQLKLGPLTSPWVVNGALVLDGTRHALGGLGRVRGTQLDAGPTGCRFTVPGDGLTLRGTVGAAIDQFAAWLYADPGGGSHHALNCSVADLELRVERQGRHHSHLKVDGGAVYELGSHDTDHGVPLQPFEDG